MNARTWAPLIALGATWAVRKGMSSAYSRRTGHEPPTPEDTEVSLARALGWAVTTAVISVAIEVVVTRAAAQYAQRDKTPELSDVAFD